jgi:hypothetical protein
VKPKRSIKDTANVDTGYLLRSLADALGMLWISREHRNVTDDTLGPDLHEVNAQDVTTSLTDRSGEPSKGSGGVV